MQRLHGINKLSALRIHRQVYLFEDLSFGTLHIQGEGLVQGWVYLAWRRESKVDLNGIGSTLFCGEQLSFWHSFTSCQIHSLEQSKFHRVEMFCRRHCSLLSF